MDEGPGAGFHSGFDAVATLNTVAQLRATIHEVPAGLGVVGNPLPGQGAGGAAPRRGYSSLPGGHAS